MSEFLAKHDIWYMRFIHTPFQKQSLIPKASMAVTKDYPKEIQEGVKKTEEYYKNSKHQSIKRYGYYERLL